MPRKSRVLVRLALCCVVGCLVLTGCGEMEFRAVPQSGIPTTTVATGLPVPEAGAGEGDVGSAGVRGSVEAVEGEVFDLTNAERVANGCPALAADERLGRAARAHSEDMATRNYFDHTSKDGQDFVARLKAAGHPSPGAENIAAGQRTAEEVVRGWMASPGHRANILNCGLRALGVGMARGGAYGVYWTQAFGW